MDTKEDSQVYHVPHVSPIGEGRDLVSTLERRLVMNIVKGHRSPNLQLFSTHQHTLTICSLGRPGNWKFTQLT